MNNKEFIGVVSNKIGTSNKDAARMISELVDVMSEQLQNGNVLALSGFGTFEVKMKKERVIVTPGSRQRLLVPPKLSLAFKASSVLKEKTQNGPSNE